MVERRSGLRATAGVGIMFATNGSVFAALLPWYPLIAAKLELSAAQFGFTVAAFAVGAIASSALPAPLSRQRPGASPRPPPVAMGTRTALPHSVQEPS